MYPSSVVIFTIIYHQGIENSSQNQLPASTAASVKEEVVVGA